VDPFDTRKRTYKQHKKQHIMLCTRNIKDELNIEKILENYSHYLEQTIAFAKYHLEHQQDSIDFITQCVDNIAHNQELFPVEQLQGTPFNRLS